MYKAVFYGEDFTCKNYEGERTVINKVEICGVDTSKLPVIPERLQKEFFIKIQNGDRSARQEFIEGNLRLVLSIIKRFYMRTDNLDDIFQVGCVGLIKSIDNFDISQNVKFSTYAVPMIIGEIKRFLRDNNQIRVSRSVRDLAYQVYQAKTSFIEKYGQEPTNEQLAKILEVDESKIVYALDATRDPISLFEPVFADGGDSLYVMDSVADEKNADDIWLTSIVLKDAVEKLAVKEKNIVKLRYFEGKTQMEVANEIGISQAQVSRLEKSAIKTIRKGYL